MGQVVWTEFLARGIHQVLGWLYLSLAGYLS